MRLKEALAGFVASYARRSRKGKLARRNYTPLRLESLEERRVFTFSINSGQIFNINENLANDSLVGTVQTTAGDGLPQFSITASTNNGMAALKIDDNGNITVLDSTLIDYEACDLEKFILEVSVHDTGDNTDSSGAVEVTLNDEEEAPVLEDRTWTIAENNAAGALVSGSAVLAQNDGKRVPPQGVAYSITSQFDAADNPVNIFQLDESRRLYVATAGVLDFEASSSYTVNIHCVDDAALTDDKAYTVQVLDRNDAPVYALQDASHAPVTISSDQASLTIDEALPNGTVIGYVTAADQDQAASTLHYQQNASGAVALDALGAFAYNSSTGEITVADASKVNFEQRTSIVLHFAVIDDAVAGDASGQRRTATLAATVNLNDVNEAPVFIARSLSIAENNTVNAVVTGGAIRATDPDTKVVPLNTISYAIVSQQDAGGNDVNLFSLNSGTQLVVAAANVLNFEASSFYTVVVRATDNGGPNMSTDQLFIVNVMDKNEKAVLTLHDAAGNPAVNLAVTKGRAHVGDIVGKINAVDPDAGLAGETHFSLPSTVPYSIDPDGTIRITRLNGLVNGNTINVTVACADGTATPLIVKWVVPIAVAPAIVDILDRRAAWEESLDSPLPSGLAVTLWDDFQRSDRNLPRDRAPTGQLWSQGGQMSVIRSNRMDAQDPSLYGQAGTNIGYLTSPVTPSLLLAEVYFQPGNAAHSGRDSAVIGSCSIGFGKGSIQLAVTSVEDKEYPTNWSLFYVPNPIQDPYPRLAAGNLRTPVVRDGKTPYWLGMSRSENTITAYLPDGQVVVVTNDAVGTYWGNRLGAQNRRPSSTDGHVVFDYVEASA